MKISVHHKEPLCNKIVSVKYGEDLTVFPPVDGFDFFKKCFISLKASSFCICE